MQQKIQEHTSAKGGRPTDQKKNEKKLKLYLKKIKKIDDPNKHN